MTSHPLIGYTMGRFEAPGLGSPFDISTVAEVHTVSNVRRFGGRGTYEIRVTGKLDPKWSDWFDGFTVTPAGGAETKLTGTVADQAALHGMLHKIRDLGLPLLSVRRLDEDE